MANNLKKLRENHNLSLRDLEKITGIANSTLSDIEHSKGKIAPQNLAVLCDFFDVSYAYLLNKTEDELKQLNLSKTKISFLLKNGEFKSTIQKECYILLSSIAEENNLEVIREMIITMLKRENMKYYNNPELNLDKIRKKYLIDTSDNKC